MHRLVQVAGAVLMVLGAMVAAVMSIMLWMIPAGNSWNMWSFGLMLVSSFVLIGAGAELLSICEGLQFCKPGCKCRGRP